MQTLYNTIEKTMNAIETDWQKANYSTDYFPDIALEHARSLDFSSLGEVKNQLSLLDLPGIRIQQQRSTFSDMYIQIYNNGRFLIEILNWWGEHVNVHDHDFSALQFQLKGDALNTTYSFHESKKHGALRFGSLSLIESEIWKENGHSIVRPGANQPHSVFHLGAPTTSLLIRTIPTPRYGAQSNYFPNIAAHYYVSNDIQRKKLTGLSLLSRGSKEDFKSTFNHFIDTQSLSENFFMMIKLGPILFQPKFINLLHNYSSRGENEATLVRNVAINNGINFFKSKANSTVDISYDEKIAAFAVAATNSEENFELLKNQLRKNGFFLDLNNALNTFLTKLSDEDQYIAHRYLDIFQISGLRHE